MPNHEPYASIVSHPRTDDPYTSDWTLTGESAAHVQKMIDRIMDQDGVVHAEFDMPFRYWPEGQPRRYRAQGRVTVLPLPPGHPLAPQNAP